jgi:hypothetical protein
MEALIDEWLAVVGPVDGLGADSGVSQMLEDDLRPIR